MRNRIFQSDDAATDPVQALFVWRRVIGRELVPAFGEGAQPVIFRNSGGQLFAKNDDIVLDRSFLGMSFGVIAWHVGPPSAVDGGTVT
jgi:hypothetical protein